MLHLGSDTDQLRSWVDDVARGREQIDVRLTDLDGVIRAIAWLGSDAETFRTTWGEVRSRAAARLELLQADAEEAGRHAEEQEQASSAESDGRTGITAVEARPGWTWPWDDGGAWPWGGEEDLRDEIPLDDVDEYGLEAMNQGNSGNCVVVAALGALSEADPQFFMDQIERTGPETYEVTLYDSDGDPVVYTVEDSIARGPMVGADGQQNWMSLYEDALIQHGMLEADGEYSSTFSGSAVQEAVTGAETEYYEMGSVVQSATPEYFPERLIADLEAGGTVMFGTDDNGADANGQDFVENHAYVVESVNDDGTVTVVNPWGEDAGYWLNGQYRTDVPIEELEDHFDAVWVSAPPEEWSEQE